MRHGTWVVGLGALALAAGCADSKWAFIRNNNRDVAAVRGDNPSAADLVAYLNQNSQRIQTIECPDLSMDCQQGFHQFGMPGRMVCQKPRNFRLVAEPLASREADIGSNDQEFWYWIKRADPPYLIHCSYQDFERGVSIPFPFQPEWVMEALGCASYSTAEAYRVIPKGNYLELVQEINYQGQRVQKVTVFNKAPSRFQVVGHRLRDAKGKDICFARITDAQNIGGAIVPRVIVLEYPAENLTLKMKLYDDSRNVFVNRQLAPGQVDALFNRPRLEGVQSFDLARRTVDLPTSQIRAAGAFAPQR